MSFILDALKKSESERQRQRRPGLAEVPVGRRSKTQSWWAAAVLGLLVVNLVVLLVVLLRRGESSTPETKPAAAAVTTAPPAAPSAQPQSRPPPPAAPAGTLPVTQPAQGSPAVRSLAEEATPAPMVEYENLPPWTDVPLADEPLVRSLAAPAAAAPDAATSGMRTIDEAAASGITPPELHLDVHVYSAQPTERFVFINSRRYAEGQALNEGPTVERITPEGVVLNQGGQRYLLPRP